MGTASVYPYSNEAAGLPGDQSKLQGLGWDVIGSLNDHFDTLGYIVIPIFALGWLASVVICRARRFDEPEVNRQELKQGRTVDSAA
jgi:hypothetical protein